MSSTGLRGRWWLPLVTAVVLLVPVGGLSCVSLGFAVMATDNCGAGGPCPAGDQLTRNYGCALAATLLFLIVAAIFPRRPERQGLRWAGAALATLSAAWPIVWLVVTGGPDV